MRFATTTCLLTCLLWACGCARPPDRAPAAAPPAKQPVASKACFLVHDLGRGETVRSPGDACSTRVSPASTFKIPHSLAALDANVLSGPDFLIKYEPGDSVFESWKRDHTLATAMRYSVVWYYQRVATMLGVQREQDYLRRFNYGNRDASSGLTTFWLDGSLQISPDEQAKFLVDLYEDRLPVTPEARNAVRRILIQPEGRVVNAMGERAFAAPWPAGTVLSAKTGSGDHAKWLVGHVQRGDKAWVFVSCVTGDDLDPGSAIDLAAASLRSHGVL